MRTCRIVGIAALNVLAASTLVLGGPLELQPRMGQPLNGLTSDQLARFEAGNVAFNHVFQVSEGLGPIFNQTNCASCHNNPVGGSGSITVTRFGLLDKKGFDPLASLGGSLLQAEGISLECQEEIPPEANVVTLRLTPSTLGFGLVEAIPDVDIIANATNPPPGVSGVVHMVPMLENPPPGGPLRAGRFGWKSQLATVLSFSGDATLNEMGITNELVPDENAPNGDEKLLAQCDTVADPEDVPDGMGVRFIDKVTDFQRFLAPPPQTPRSGMTGEALFNSIGCSACHIASFTTPDDAGLEDAIRNKVLKPYSDFLLHDMGLLGDNIVQGDAQPTEMRTAPLWGLRVRDPMLHNASVVAGTFADRVLGAIAAHGLFGSEAKPSAEAFNALLPAQKDAVIAFLDSLGRAEFDQDGDNDVDDNDLTAFIACYTGPGSFYTPDAPCAISDVDQDGDVDIDDAYLFTQAYSGPAGDCNGNDMLDPLDVLVGLSPDCNANSMPDECDYTNVAQFVTALLTADASMVCIYDQNDDATLDGDDVNPYVASIIP